MTDPTELELAVARAIRLDLLPACDDEELLDTARAALAEAFLWRPIETAPKDGRQVVLALKPNSDESIEYEVGRWCAFDGIDGYWVSSDGLDFSYGFAIFTHWLPLPLLQEGS